MRRLPMLFGLVLLGLSLLVGAGATQDGKKVDTKKEAGKVKGQLPDGFKDLNLTAAQKEKVYTIQADFKAKIADLDKKIKELKGESQKAVFGVLTKDQQDKYLKSKGIEGTPAKDKDKK